VDAVAPQPRPLVEPLLRAGRLGNDAQHVEHSSLRRRASSRQLEQDRLSGHELAEALHARRNTDLELTRTRGACHDHSRARRPSDLRRERAHVDCVEPRASPPPASESEGERDQPRPPLGFDSSSGDRDGHREGCDDRFRHANDVRRRDPGTERRQQRVRKVESKPFAHPSHWAGECENEVWITGRPGPGAGRAAPDRCPEWHRARRPSGRRHAPVGSRGSSAR
jgi:hypothetical protein